LTARLVIHLAADFGSGSPNPNDPATNYLAYKQQEWIFPQSPVILKVRAFDPKSIFDHIRSGAMTRYNQHVW